MNKIDKALAFTLKWEGGYVDNPLDKGGITNYGISQRHYPNLDIKNLTLEKVKEIYECHYWTRAGCPWMKDEKLAIVAFDTAVNCGVGFVTEALKTCNTVDELLEARKQRYFNIITKNPTQRTFRKGWSNRVNDLAELVGSSVRWVVEETKDNVDKPKVNNNKK